MADPRTFVSDAFILRFDPKFFIETLASNMAYKNRPLFWGFGTFLTKGMFKKQRENQRRLSNHPHTSHKIIPRVQTNDRKFYFMTI